MISSIETSTHAAASLADLKLKKATQEFESILLSSWLEKMREGCEFGGSDSAMPGGDSMNALATQAVAQAIAARGGLGIGKMMYDQLHKD